MQKKSVQTAAIYALPCLLSIGYAAFAAFSKRADGVGIMLGGGCTLLFALLLLRLLPAFFNFFAAADMPPPCAALGERSRKRLHPWAKIIIAAFCVQILMIAAVYAVDTAANGYSGTVIQTYPRLFITGKGSAVRAADALSELGLLSAAGEYVFPRAIAAGIGVYSGFAPLGFTAAGLAFALNTLLVCAAAVLLYELALLDFKKRTAVLAVVIMLLPPMLLLLMQPASGFSAFTLFALAAAYCARRGHFIRSGIFAATASAFNVFGVLLALLALTEGIKACCIKKRSGEKFAGICARCIVGMLLPVALAATATCSLIYFNLLDERFLKGVSVSGGEFKFLFESASALFRLESPEAWISLAAFIAFAFLIFVGAKRVRFSIVLLCFAWLAVALPNAAPKYGFALTAGFPFVPLLVSALVKNDKCV